jgi:hypothetical protein
MDTFDLRKYLVEGRLYENEIENELVNKLKSLGSELKSKAEKTEVSPKDKEVNEIGFAGIGALVVGAPGLMSFLGKTANAIADVAKKGTDSAVFDKETYKKGGAKNLTQTKFGKGLVDAGHKLEEFYLDSIGGWIAGAYPSKFKDQHVNGKVVDGSELDKITHQIYTGLLVAGAIGAAFEAVNATSAIMSSFEGGTAGLKAKEVIDLAQKIAAM